jgi:hypothetical protein
VKYDDQGKLVADDPPLHSDGYNRH